MSKAIRVVQKKKRFEKEMRRGGEQQQYKRVRELMLAG